MSTEYKTDEKIIQDIIRRNVTTTDPDQRISLTTYYKTQKTSQLILRNRPTKKIPALQEDHVIYQHSCTSEDCGPHNYIGMTRTKLSRRLTCHLQNGSIKSHYKNQHKVSLSRQHLEKGTTIIDRERDPRRLTFLEAIYIAQLKPSMNSQIEDLQVLPTFKRQTTRSTTPTV